MVTAATGIISTIAGGGQGFSGDGGAATAAQFSHPTGLARNGNGNYILLTSSINVFVKSPRPRVSSVLLQEQVPLAIQGMEAFQRLLP